MFKSKFVLRKNDKDFIQDSCLLVIKMKLKMKKVDYITEYDL